MASLPGTALSDPAERYLELLKGTLTRAIAPERFGAYRPERRPFRHRLASGLARLLLGQEAAVVRRLPLDQASREEGRDWPSEAETMVGRMRLDQLHEAVRTVVRERVPGDLIETGVWRGGSCILMRGAVVAYGDPDRTVWVADSFEGLPPPDATRYPADAGDRHHVWDALRISEAEVRRNFERYGLLDDHVRFLRGWFKDTLKSAPIEALSVLRLDGDMYESTMDALTALYDRLSPGGFCIVDDHGAVPACARAISDFREARGIREPIVKIDWTGVFWRKSP